MIRRLPLILLLAVCIATLFFQLNGGYAQNIHLSTVRHVVMPPMMALATSIGSGIALLLGVVLTARKKQWKWMLGIIFTTYIGAAIYVIYSFVQEYRQYTKMSEPTTTAFSVIDKVDA